MDYQIVPVTPFEQNCSVIWCPETRKAAVVDPGGDLPRIKAALTKHQLSLESILLTHTHIDHAGGTAALAREFDVPIIGPHIEDLFWIQALPQQAAMFGFPPAEAFTPTRWLTHGDTVQVGNQTLQVVHCPGHTPGHVVFYHDGAKLAWVGDVLFKGSIGRTDFPKGDYQILIDSIRNRLWPLGDEVLFVPGHGPTSTFGEERRSNPFVGDRA
ncbi:MAG: MBL fold metallo-hydrolase [Hahellaceae bacterium]|nr:MBL fold metallo-hydrolase [Hahellaceae bacterium]